MDFEPLTPFPRPLRQAVESAGYRLARWAAACGVLRARVTKGRVGGDLGRFLERWLPSEAPVVSDDELRLDLVMQPERIQLVGDSLSLSSSSAERALLHLPALRGFWRQELRSEHFAALQSAVPRVWLRDKTPIPQGSVIHGLGVTSWEQASRVQGTEWNETDDILNTITVDGTRIMARYVRNERNRLVLSSLEALS